MDIDTSGAGISLIRRVLRVEKVRRFLMAVQEMGLPWMLMVFGSYGLEPRFFFVGLGCIIIYRSLGLFW